MSLRIRVLRVFVATFISAKHARIRRISACSAISAANSLEPQLRADADQARLQDRKRRSASVRRRRQERGDGRTQRRALAEDYARVRGVEQVDLGLGGHATELECPPDTEVELAVMRLVAGARRSELHRDRWIAGIPQRQYDRARNTARHRAVPRVNRGAARNRPAHTTRGGLDRPRVALKRGTYLDAVPQRHVAIHLETILVRDR